MSTTARKFFSLFLFVGVQALLPGWAQDSHRVASEFRLDHRSKSVVEIFSGKHNKNKNKEPKRKGSESGDRTLKTTPTGERRSRGYVTTPQELAEIARNAQSGRQPYSDAVLSIRNYANTGSAAVRPSGTTPDFWPFGSISGDQHCAKPQDPAFLGDGAPLVEAKAIVYHLTGDSRYADDVRKHILELSSTTGYNDDQYSGANKCILNLSWFVPSWIIAADLLDGYAGWSAADKQTFQSWLADVAYRKTDWASDVKVNNWGAAGSAASGMIADYLDGAGIPLRDREGKTISAKDAYEKAKRRQIDRMNGNSYMNTTGCPNNRGQGIRPDGGIPWELVRGSTGCDGRWLVEADHSWTYMITSITAIVQHAELLWRRGDDSIYENINKDGSGSLIKAIHFVIHNPNNPSKSLDWKKHHEQALEFMHRYLSAKGKPDPFIAEQLRIGANDRALSTVEGRELYFGTLLQAFDPGSRPSPPPVVAPPGMSASAPDARSSDVKASK